MSFAVPVLVTPEQPYQPLIGSPELCERVEAHLRERGAVLLRGFHVAGQRALSAFASAFGQPLLGHDRSTRPRTALGRGVYTSSAYAEQRSISLYNEGSNTRAWPMKLWFYCEQAAESGGDTLLADSRRIHDIIPARLRERFARDGLLYVRNYGRGLDVEWDQVFGTGQRAEVERLCAQRGISCEWLGQQLRTRERAQAVARHPRTGEWVWFNQAHLFHSSALPEAERAALLDVCGEERLPRNVYFGDGSAIPDGMLAEIRAVLEREQAKFPWQTGDVLMLDNMLVAHARERYSGPRKMLLAMAELYTARRCAGEGYF